jgi:hypothetical protein
LIDGVACSTQKNITSEVFFQKENSFSHNKDFKYNINLIWISKTLNPENKYIAPMKNENINYIDTVQTWA